MLLADSPIFVRRQAHAASTGLIGLGVHIVYLSRKQLPRAMSAFIDFTIDKVQKYMLV